MVLSFELVQKENHEKNTNGIMRNCFFNLWWCL